MSPEEKIKLKQVFELVKTGKLKEAMQIADTLSSDAINQIPDSILFKFANLQEMSGTGGGVGDGAAFTPGTGVGVATKNAFRKPKKPRKPFKKFPPRNTRLSSLLNEVTYGKFKNQTKTRTKQQTLHTAVKEIRKRVNEVNKILEYTNKMRSELSEGEQLKYNRFTENALKQISSKIAEIYGNIKKLNK